MITPEEFRAAQNQERIADALEEIGRQLKLANQIKLEREYNQIRDWSTIDLSLLDQGQKKADEREATDRRVEQTADYNILM